MKEILKYTTKYKGLFGLRLFLTMFKAIANVAFAVVLGKVIDIFTSGAVKDFAGTILMCCIFLLAEVVLFLIDGNIASKYSEKTIGYMRENIFSHIMKKDVRTFSKNNTGSYMSVLNNDISLIKTEFIDNIFNFILQIVSFIATMIVMLRISKLVTLTIVGISILSFISTSLIGKKIVNKQGEYSRSLEQLMKVTKDLFLGFELIRNFNIISKINRIFNRNSSKVERHRRKYFVLVNIIDTVSVSWGMITFLAVLLICGIGVYRGTMTAGTVIVVTQLIDSITEPILEIISLGSSMASVKQIGDKVSKIVSSTNEPKGTKVKDDFNNKLSISNLKFKYNNGKEILKNISFDFEAGKKYIIVGESGSGKSTLIKLIMRYYKDYEGTIEIDGTNIYDITDESFYNIFSLIQQNVFIFDESIKENLCLFNDFPESKINEAIKKAGLDKLISTLENGIDTEIGEGGDKLSGGEKQRISIGRAFLKDSKIMILDEFTSALDNQTAMAIENALTIIPNITLISITHRLIRGILEKYDEIIVMKNGEIVENGCFDELMEKRGNFYKLYYAQSDMEKDLDLVI